jgi:hypothetical protein
MSEPRILIRLLRMYVFSTELGIRLSFVKTSDWGGVWNTETTPSVSHCLLLRCCLLHCYFSLGFSTVSSNTPILLSTFSIRQSLKTTIEPKLRLRNSLGVRIPVLKLNQKPSISTGDEIYNWQISPSCLQLTRLSKNA